MNWKISKIIAVGWLAFVTGLDIQASVSYRSVALTGEVAPGTEPGLMLGGFVDPVINAKGQVSFVAGFEGQEIGSINGTGIWSEHTGSLRLVAKEGNQAPGMEPGVLFGPIFARPLNIESGRVFFSSTLNGPGVDDIIGTSVWSKGSGALTLVYKSGDPAPGTNPGVVFFNPGSSSLGFSVNGSGQAAFFERVVGPGVDNVGGPDDEGVGANEYGLWVSAGGSLALVARNGDPAPGAGAAVVFSHSFLGVTPVLNDAGQVAFRGRLIGPGVIGPFVSGTNNIGIWSGAAGSLALVARAGDPAPDTDEGVVFRTFHSAPSLNGSGQTAFVGSLAGPGVDGANNMGLWSEGSGSLRLVVREGDAAPGTGPGVVFGQRGATLVFSRTSKINGSGQTAFKGFVTGPGVNHLNNTGVWSEGTGSLNLVAREGDPAPGLGPGVMFGDFDNDQNIIFSGTGQTAFLGSLFGPGTDDTDGLGIWLSDPNGGLNLVARKGDLFDVNDDPSIDDFRTIDVLTLMTGNNRGAGGSGGQDGRATGLSDAGQLAFRLIFTDGSSGIFVATVPEPGTVAVLGVGLLGVLRRRGPGFG